jgi:putative molybdopterin biosynthesis protein
MKEIMDTKEVARYLGLNEKRIYQLAKQGEIPATRIGGKWVFPRALMDQWIFERAKGNLKEESRRKASLLIVMGSNDLAWDIIGHILRESSFHLILSNSNVGSLGGLVALDQELAHVAGIHLFDPETGQYNLPFLSKYLPGKKVAVIHLFNRRQGLIIKKGNPLKIKGVQDLTRPDVRFVNRQKGSGTRVLLDYELDRIGVFPVGIHGYQREVDTHMAVAMEVLRGKADCGMGVFSAAQSLGLGFIPIREESYDIVTPHENLKLPQVKSMLRVIKLNEFIEAMEGVGGYDLTDTGKIVWEGVA